MEVGQAVWFHRRRTMTVARWHSSLNALRAPAVLALVIGALSLNVGGTFASFSAETANDSTVSTGSLVLGDKVGTGTTCLSTGGGSADVNANLACDALFTLTLQDGGSSNVKLTLTNDGTIDASSLELYWAGGTTPCTTIDEPSEQYHGTGDLCPKMRLEVQEYPSAAAQSSNDRTSGSCWFGGGVGTNACSFTNSQNLSLFSSLDGSAANTIDLGAFTAGTTRWFRVYLNVAAGQLTNSLMGRRVDFGFTWRVLQ